MEERWLLCVDPDSKQIYTLNTNTQEVHIETAVNQEYREKAHKTIADMEKLL
jgi:phosphatidylinositol-4,5-bisphosphate 3-kinase catalytic subunit alpha/beta/delta